MKCKICNRGKQEFHVDNVGVCRNCYELAEHNFILTCLNCNSYGFLPRTTVNIARVASVLLITESNLSEMSMNALIAFIQIEKPTIVLQESCPQCQKH